MAVVQDKADVVFQHAHPFPRTVRCRVDDAIRVGDEDMSMEPEAYKEIERLARLICTSMGGHPDELRMSMAPCQDRMGGWYIPREDYSTPHLAWMHYWRAAAAIYADHLMWERSRK